MRHVSKTHRVNLAWLSEIVNKSLCSILYLPSQRQAADILTKGFDKPRLFSDLRLLIGIHDSREPQTLLCLLVMIFPAAIRLETLGLTSFDLAASS